MKIIEDLKTKLKKYRTPAKFLHLYTLSNEYLKQKAWFESTFKRQSVGQNGAIPWFTYSMISFLEPRLKRHFNVFEFGSGNSTIWFAQRVNKVISIEHDKEYFDFISKELNKYPNVDHRFTEIGKNYNGQILNYKNEFEIIIIDGRERVQCAKNSVNALTTNGIIIWDNADRQKYQEGYEFLNELGFKRIDFFGLAPIAYKETCTTIFYREGNCLGI